MHHEGRMVAVPAVKNPTWPEGYEQVLREAGAKEVAIPYCLSWVRRFFSRFPGRKREDLGRPEIESFLSEIAVRPEISNWQVQQARNALELYYEQFRGIPLQPRPDRPRSSPRLRSPSIPPDSPDSSSLYDAGKPPVNSETQGDAHARAQGEASSERTGGKPPPLPAAADDRPHPGPAELHRSDRVNWQELDQRLREYLRVEHYSYRTEKTYVDWIRRFVQFHGERKPSTLGAPEIHAFLKHLAIERQVSSSTQNCTGSASNGKSGLSG